MRIFNYEEENLKKNDKIYQETLNKKVLKKTILNLSDYSQIFIDNLNGNFDKNFSLKEIIDLKEMKYLNTF